ncbi:MAG: type II secretion system minor pseudopilin GspK [Gammaproteobacteria bacterium]|nr:type II secretion system minor pseudopilin GspK [Gammaproteobacteria bacterium]
MARNQHHPKAQRGAAIIVALFVVSLVAAAAVAMIVRLSIDIRRTDLSQHANQADLYAAGSIAWAMDQLTENLKHQKTKQLTDKTPIQSKTDEMNGYTISSTIEDAQGKFNINNLASQDAINNYIRLIHAADTGLSLDAINKIVVATRDWVLPNNVTELESYYQKQVPAYRAPHRPMVSISELRLVRGMTSTLYNHLLPYVTALPVMTLINVNNTSVPVLMSLSATLTKESATAILNHFKQNPAITVQDFQNFDTVKNNPIPATQITVTSAYFLVKTNVTVGQQQTVIYTLLARVSKGNQPAITVLWQTKGTQ